METARVSKGFRLLIETRQKTRSVSVHITILPSSPCLVSCVKAFLHSIHS